MRIESRIRQRSFVEEDETYGSTMPQASPAKNTSLFDESKVPKHRFGLSMPSLRTVYRKFDITYPKLVQALKEENSKKFFELIAEQASLFIRRVTRDQQIINNSLALTESQKQKPVEVIDAHNATVIEFLKFYLSEKAIDEKNVIARLKLTDADIIEYLKIIAFFDEMSTEYFGNNNPNSEELAQYARLHVVRPFIQNLLPIDPILIEKLTPEKENLMLQDEKKVLIKKIIKTHVLAKNLKDSEILQRIVLELSSIHARLKKEESCLWLKRLFERHPNLKITVINVLIEKAKKADCTLDEIDQALSTALENEHTLAHRNYFKRCFGRLFNPAPPRIAEELGKIRSALDSRIFSAKIASRFA